MPKPIRAAYEGAISEPCSNCGAASGAYCTAPSGHLRRIPCASRCRAIPASLGSSDPDEDSAAAQGRSAPKTTPLPLDYDDITEPRRPWGEQ